MQKSPKIYLVVRYLSPDCTSGYKVIYKPLLCSSKATAIKNELLVNYFKGGLNLKRINAFRSLDINTLKNYFSEDNIVSQGDIHLGLEDLSSSDSAHLNALLNDFGFKLYGVIEAPNDLPDTIYEEFEQDDQVIDDFIKSASEDELYDADLCVKTKQGYILKHSKVGKNILFDPTRVEYVRNPKKQNRDPLTGSARWRTSSPSEKTRLTHQYMDSLTTFAISETQKIVVPDTKPRTGAFRPFGRD